MGRMQIIVVMGVTGVGKSTFIRYATGLDVPVGHGQEACTAKVQAYQIPGTDVYLLDTPGFDDTYLSDSEILGNIATALVDAFEGQGDIKGAVYVHQITEAKMRGSGRKNLIMFQSLLGMESMDHCRLVTTKWTSQPRSMSEARERELCDKKEFWQPLLDAGAQTVRFGDSRESAIEIIEPLVHGSPFEPLIVKEIVEDHLQTDDTQAGIIVNDDIEKLKKKHRADLEDVETRSIRAVGAVKQAMLEQADEYKAKLQKLEQDQALLRRPIQSSGSFGRWIARGCAMVGGTVMTAISGGLLAPAAVAWVAGTEISNQAQKHCR